MHAVMESNHICMENCVSLQEAGVGCLVIMQLDFVVECVVTVGRDGRGECLVTQPGIVEIPSSRIRGTGEWKRVGDEVGGRYEEGVARCVRQTV